MQLQQGIFITFEGPDGSGKSTLAKHLYEYCINKNIATVLTREPGGNGVKLSEAIRELLLNADNLNICYEAEALLFAASRAQHVNELIIPNLQQKKLVICDRYLHSSLAYQGFARKLGIKQIQEINQIATHNLKPDIIFYIDVDYQMGLDRIIKNNRAQNRLDKESIELHKLVHDGYQEVLRLCDKDNFIIINAQDNLEEVKARVIAAFKQFMEHQHYDL